MKRRKFNQLAALGAAGTMISPLAFAAASPAELKASDFGKDFKWGTATAAYQIEGAHDADGKGPSVWDTFSHKKGKILDKTNGDVACDHYNRYPEDIALLKEMNFQVNRFSISWSRILPDGNGKVNQAGIDHYHKVIDKCLEIGVEPWITLYHWDLPQALEDKGGWANREVIDWFSNYVDICTKEFGGKVKNWMIFNEPTAFVGLGYLMGLHAPGHKSLKKFYKATHHVCMCQAEGGRITRRNVKDAFIGTTFSCSHIEPWRPGKDDKAVKRLDAILNRLFIEPLLGMGYPTDGWKSLKNVEKQMQPGDAEKLTFDFDFIGLQNYFRIKAKKSLFPPLIWANQVQPTKWLDKSELTDMGWEVSPEGLYKVLKQFNKYGLKNIIVTENGAAFPDKLENGRVHDPRRTQFYKDYLSNVLRAKKEGVNITGYFCWTLMDNFEWAEGYHPRFGLIHIDFETQKRTIKDTGLWFKEFLANK